MIVGIDDYRGAPLHGSVNDARAVSGVLETHGSGAPNFQVLLMTSPSDDVTRSKLREAIEKLFATHCDIALLYFSGMASSGARTAG
ncbi:MAG: caspase family protein [Holophagales bacterium]|nr:caspase family protein [Holophagales bacterium]